MSVCCITYKNNSYCLSANKFLFGTDVANNFDVTDLTIDDMCFVQGTNMEFGTFQNQRVLKYKNIEFKISTHLIVINEQNEYTCIVEQNTKYMCYFVYVFRNDKLIWLQHFYDVVYNIRFYKNTMYIHINKNGQFYKLEKYDTISFEKTDIDVSNVKGNPVIFTFDECKLNILFAFTNWYGYSVDISYDTACVDKIEQLFYYSNDKLCNIIFNNS